MMKIYITDTKEPETIRELEGDFVAVVNSETMESSTEMRTEKLGAFHESLPVLIALKNVYDALRQQFPAAAVVYRKAVMETLSDDEFWDWEE